MIIYSLPETLDGIVFDIDKTLYDNDGYAQRQIDVLIERLAEERSEDPAVTRDLVLERQKGRDGGGKEARRSLGNTFVDFGIPIETSVSWREELIHPDRYLAEDDSLKKALSELADRYAITAVTNNPVKIGRKTLEVLGVESLFSGILGLDTSMKSKPDPENFRLAAKRIGCAPDRMISVGDRYAVDIEPALSLGMGGILVDGVKDVYGLPVLLGIAD